MAHELVEYFAVRQDETLALLRRLVELESPSSDKAALDRLGTFIAEQLRDVGASVEVMPQKHAGDHLAATFGHGNAAPIVTLCHIDTVWPVGTLATMPWREVDGKLRGPGVEDMKAGTAILISVLRYLRAARRQLSHPLRML